MCIKGSAGQVSADSIDQYSADTTFSTHDPLNVGQCFFALRYKQSFTGSDSYSGEYLTMTRKKIIHEFLTLRCIHKRAQDFSKLKDLCVWVCSMTLPVCEMGGQRTKQANCNWTSFVTSAKLQIPVDFLLKTNFIQFIQLYMLIFNIQRVLYGTWLLTSHQSSQHQWPRVSDLSLKLCAPWDVGFRPPSDQRVTSKMVSNVGFL